MISQAVAFGSVARSRLCRTERHASRIPYWVLLGLFHSARVKSVEPYTAAFWGPQGTREEASSDSLSRIQHPLAGDLEAQPLSITAQLDVPTPIAVISGDAVRAPATCAKWSPEPGYGCSESDRWQHIDSVPDAGSCLQACHLKVASVGPVCCYMASDSKCWMNPGASVVRGKGWVAMCSRAAKKEEVDEGGGDTNNAHNVKCLVLVADYDNEKGVKTIVETVSTVAPDCHVHVVAKGGNIKCDVHRRQHGYRGVHVSCEEKENVGREFGTVSTWIAENYDNLPDVLVLCPSSVHDHNRMAKFNNLLINRGEGGFDCAIELSPAGQVIRDGNGLPIVEPGADEQFHAKQLSHLALTVGSVAGLRKGSYDKGGSNKWSLTPASPRGLGNWLLHHTGEDAMPALYADALVCTNGIFRTSRAALRRQSLHVPRGEPFYRELSSALNVSSAPEAGHYAELAARILFGVPNSTDGLLGPLSSPPWADSASGDRESSRSDFMSGVVAGAIVGSIVGIVIGSEIRKRSTGTDSRPPQAQLGELQMQHLAARQTGSP